MHYIANPKDMAESCSTVLLCKTIADKLESQYGGWLWAVQPEEDRGVLYVRSLRLSGRIGVVIRLVDIQNDPQVRMAVRLCGELLERAGAKRGPYNTQEWRDLPRFGGAVDIDMDDKMTAKQRAVRALRRAIATGKVKAALGEAGETGRAEK